MFLLIMKFSCYLFMNMIIVLTYEFYFHYSCILISMIFPRIKLIIFFKSYRFLYNIFLLIFCTIFKEKLKLAYMLLIAICFFICIREEVDTQ